MIAMGTLMLSYLHHTCAMFRIAWYEIARKHVYIKIDETILIDFKLPKLQNNIF